MTECSLRGGIVRGDLWETLRPQSDGASDFFSWRLYRFLKKNGGAVRFVFSPEAAMTVGAGFVDPREVYLVPGERPWPAGRLAGMGATTLSSVITSDRAPRSIMIGEADVVDRTDEFLAAYREHGRTLFSVVHDPTRFLTRTAGGSRGLLICFKRSFVAHLSRLLPREDVARLDLSFHVAVGSEWRGRIFFPGDVINERPPLEADSYAVFVARRLHGDPDILEGVAAHEARHLWQHRTGRLVAPHGGDEFVWEGRPYSRADQDYFDWPHEVDANLYAQARYAGYKGDEGDKTFAREGADTAANSAKSWAKNDDVVRLVKR